ncbi:MAG: hypothetical protein R3F16_24120 [Myxococcota bacterium]
MSDRLEIADVLLTHARSSPRWIVSLAGRRPSQASSATRRQFRTGCRPRRPAAAARRRRRDRLRPRPSLARTLDRPDLEAVEVADLALRTLPLAATQAELDVDLLALAESVELLAAVARELEEHVLRISGGGVELDDELALAEARRDLLGLERPVELPADLHVHRADDPFGAAR